MRYSRVHHFPLPHTQLATSSSPLKSLGFQKFLFKEQHHDYMLLTPQGNDGKPVMQGLCLSLKAFQSS